MKIDVAHYVVPRAGERKCGDAVIERSEDGLHLLALIDALGHGASASEVAEVAITHLQQVSLGRQLEAIMQGLHEALSGTRGAAALVCLISQATLRACSVGNVQMRMQGGDLPVQLSPGILGVRVRKMRTFEGSLHGGERLAVFSDGVSSRFVLGELRHVGPRQACEAIMKDFRHSHDDASVLVADVEASG